MRKIPLAIAAVAVLVLAAVAWCTSTLRAQGALQTLDGTLSIVWGDPQPGSVSGGEILYTLTLADGRDLPLQLTPEQAATANAQYFSKRVVVSARVAPGQAAPANAPPAPAVVDTITLAPTQLAEPQAAVLGTKRVIYLLVKFPDDAAVPHPPVFYTDMNNPDTPPAGEVFPTTVNGFFKKTSSNQFSWIGDVGGVGGVGAPGGWLTLPQPKSYYAPCNFSVSCAQLGTLATDATAVGRAQGINFTSYDNINFVLSNDLDCCAWGGSFFSSVDSKSYGATWEPPWGQNTGTYAHEMGHSIGLPHSGWVYYAYDSPWDVMSSITSATSVTCGSYFSTNNGTVRSLSCSEPGDGYIAPHRDSLGWIPLANQVVTKTVSSVTVSLEGGALPLTSAIKMIKICLPGLSCSGAAAHYITVEARVKGLGTASQFDNGIPGDGIIIHDVQFGRPAIGGTCFFNSQSGWAVPIDATPGDYDSVGCNTGGRVFPNYGLYNAQWLPGQTYVNSTYKLRIAVGSRTGSSFLVSVTGTNRLAPADFDGDGKTDISVFRPSTGIWYTKRSIDGAGVFNQWGLAGDIPVPGDYDGDGRIDVAVFRPSTGIWYIQNSRDGSLAFLQWGITGDIPAPGDYDGDGKADAAVFRPSTGIWYVRDLATNTASFYQWGLNGDIPVAADYDGDRKTDVAVFRPSTGIWYIRNSTDGSQSFLQWGITGDVPVPGDYDGDGKADSAVFRPSTNIWYVRNLSTNTASFYQWGATGDIQAPGDYDGDGKTDVAVFRPSTGMFYIWYMGSGTFAYYQWGLSGDVPVLKR